MIKFRDTSNVFLKRNIKIFVNRYMPSVCHSLLFIFSLRISHQQFWSGNGLDIRLCVRLYIKFNIRQLLPADVPNIPWIFFSENTYFSSFLRNMFWATIYYISTMEYQVFLNINKKNGPDLNVTRTKPHKYQVFVWKTGDLRRYWMIPYWF